MSVIVSFVTFSLSSCKSRGVITSFLEKIRHFPEVHFITSINSVRNLVVTGTNLLRKHQMKNICFSLFTFNQSRIQFETLEYCLHSEEHLTHHL